MEALHSSHFTWKEWLMAVRPKTLATAIIPFLSGTFLAYALGYSIDWLLLCFCWLSAICIQVGTNFTNDAYDFKRGTDKKGVLGPERPTRAALLSGRLKFRDVANAGLVCFAGALAFGVPLIAQGGWVVAVVLTLSAIAGWLYTAGPFPLAYHGLGDIFVIIFYGMVATNAAYWLQTGELTGQSFMLAAQIGCLCTSMIAINNLRDVFEDAISIKRTLPVRFGILFGKWEIAFMLVMPLMINCFWPWTLTAWLPWLSAPMAISIIIKVVTHAPSKDYNRFLALSGANMLVFCFLQTIGFIVEGST
jgi:1,4-dihydroxy-2-naphthoate octaprenyltransferase